MPESRGLGDVYKRQRSLFLIANKPQQTHRFTLGHQLSILQLTATGIPPHAAKRSFALSQSEQTTTNPPFYAWTPVVHFTTHRDWNSPTRRQKVVHSISKRTIRTNPPFYIWPIVVHFISQHCSCSHVSATSFRPHGTERTFCDVKKLAFDSGH